MSVNGENGENGAGGTPPNPPDAGVSDPSVDLIAQAEKAAEEAAKAAEAAKARAAALAAARSPTTARPVEAQKPAPAPTATPAAKADEGGLRMLPNPDGLFDPKVIDEKRAEGYEPVAVAPEVAAVNRKAFLILAGMLAASAVAIVLVAVSSEASTRVSKYLEGFKCGEHGSASCIEEHIEGEARKKEEEWRNEDYRARPMYGDITLTYFPKDAKVEFFQKVYVKAGNDWRADSAGPGTQVTDCAQLLPEDKKKQLAAAGHGDPVCNAQTGEVGYPNQSQLLKPGEYVERLPFRNLPIFTTERYPLCPPEDLACDVNVGGSVSKARNFEYRIVFSREGYEPYELKITREGWTKGAGASNSIYMWNGLDLQPKPETLRDNFIRARRDVFCLMKIQKIETYEKLPAENRDLIMARNGFKSWEAYLEVEGVLTTGENEASWKETQAAIEKEECPGAPAKGK